MHFSEGKISRRSFLAAGAIAAVSSLLPASAMAMGRFILPYEKKLSFFNFYTGERLEAVYGKGGEYFPGALKEIDYILRDHRSGDIESIDVRLLDLLNLLSKELGTKEPFHIISGYRSPSTNKELQRKGRGVSRRSMHMLGKAVDIHLPDIELPLLRSAAVKLKGGGVGYYPGKKFIHVDVGPIRYW